MGNPMLVLDTDHLTALERHLRLTNYEDVLPSTDLRKTLDPNAFQPRLFLPNETSYSE